MNEDQIGVTIESGLSDWQIVQQNATGFGTIQLRGRWKPDASGQPGRVEVRVVAQDTGVAISPETDWQAADTRSDGTWDITLSRVPAGGLYRVETHLNHLPVASAEWSVRGDIRHCIGVGDVWVIAGQSNSAGYGRGAYFDPPELGIHLYRNSGYWALATHPMNDSTDTLHSINRENANPSHSPYLHFARVLKQQLNYPIGLVQTALGGSPLSRWNPTEHDDAAKADLFANMQQTVIATGGPVKGVLWYQGESDASEALSPSYEQRFIAAVQAWRAALHQPNLPVITVQLNRVYRPPTDPQTETLEQANTGWSVVREAQRQVSHKLAGVSVVPALDLPLSDLIHTSPAGNMLLGERMARAALGAVYQHSHHHLAPDAQSATLNADGRSIQVAFANVTSRIDSIDLTTHCFKVEDAQGDVPITSVTYPGNATLQIALTRPVAGSAQVHGAYGVNPAIAPVDMDRVIPMLGFYGLIVQS